MAFRAGYGTIAQDSPAPSDVDAERAAMLQTSSSKITFVSRCADHLTVNVTKSWGDAVLLGCYLITGLLDSSSIMTWGSFVSMQTGKHLFFLSSFANQYGRKGLTNIHRKHSLSRPRHHRPRRRRPLAPRPHLHPLLLHRQFLLQHFPPLLLALQTLGPDRLFLHANAAHPHRSTNGDARPQSRQIHSTKRLGRRLDRARGVPVLRPGYHVACVAVQWPDERGVDFELLRFVLGSWTV